MLEQELKFIVKDVAVLDGVLDSDVIRPLILGEADPAAERFHAVYYDTPELQLESRRCSLRARREGRRFRAALKMPGHIVDGLSRREEYEVDIEDWPAAVSDLPDEEFRLRVCELIPADSTLIPRIEVDMMRRAVHLEVDGSQVELVLDEGEIRAGGLKTPLCEVELELMRGDVADVLSLGETLEQRFPLERSTLSKHAMGIRLLRQTDGSG
jgi:triphosphatase